jgi:glycosyltransferase involved in cell wall biosynthesis
LADLRRHHDPLYGDFSRLIQGTFDEAAAHFGRESIDLLHIDGYHTYDAVRGDFQAWLPKVREGGIILLHDVNVHEGDFGAWKLWEEVKNDYPAFAFSHQHGLGVIVKGTSWPEALLPFTRDDEQTNLVRDFFAQLGRRISARIEKEQAVEELTCLVKAKEREIMEIWDRRDREIHQLWVLRDQENQLLWTQIVDRDQQLQTLRDQLIETERRLKQSAAKSPNVVARLLRAALRPAQTLQAKGLRTYQVWQEQGLRVVLRKIYMRMRNRFSKIDWGGALHATVDDFPESRRLGKGNVLRLRGACYHSHQAIKRLEILVDGKAHPVAATHMSRTAFQPQGPRSHLSGFCGLVPIDANPERPSAHLAIRAHLRNGLTCTNPLGDVKIENIPQFETPSLALGGGHRATIAICMTTHNPPPRLFEKQIRSIQEQTNQDWICIICDDCSDADSYEHIIRVVGADTRFHIYRNTTALGFYRNFEKCLFMAPSDVRFIALADHDDAWYPEKLTTLLAAFDDETMLAYSDMRIVDEHEQHLSDTYWVERRNNYRSFASLFLANTVTGAASMFRRELLEYLLPFPDPIGGAFHDHWIGCTAMALGRLEYIDRPLYDYVQHGSNVLGFRQLPRKIGLNTVARLTKAMLPLNLRTRWRGWRERAKAIYLNDVQRLEQIALTLRLRCNDRLNKSKDRTLRRIATLDRSWSGAFWLMGRSLLSFRRRTVTMGAENGLLRALVWKWGLKLRAQLSLGPRVAPTPAATLPPRIALDAFASALERVDAIEQKIAPLRVCKIDTAPERINLLIPTIDFNYVFGGYITKFHLALRLAAEGHRVRIILVDYTDYQPELWRQQLQAYPGLERLLDTVEVACVFDRSRPVEFHPLDSIIATTWWTAHIAHRALADLGRSYFVYLIQEYETYTFPMGTYAALADQSYRLPHFAVFSTELLREHFRRHNLGVFAHGRQAGDEDSTAFANTITASGSLQVADLASRKVKKLLFYARPESHAARNMFEMGIAALRRAVAAGYFTGPWEFHGIGTVATTGRVALGGATLQLLPRQSQESYREVLREHDVGLSLMYTPHPSLVPIEMAAAGMLTVTNTYGTKTAESLTAISRNLIPVEPSVEAVQEGLKIAAANVGDFPSRLRGSAVSWSATWDDAFNAAVMARLAEFLRRSRRSDDGLSRAA